MTTHYVPGTGETDPRRVIMSLQNIATTANNLTTGAPRSVKGNANSFTGETSDLTNPAVLGIELVPTANTVSWSGNSEANTALLTSQSGAGQTYLSNPALGVQQYYNLINVTSDVVSCGSNAGASFAVGLTINHAFGGTGATGGREGLFVALTQIAATDAGNAIPFYTAVSGQAQANSSDGGTIGGGEKGKHYGSNFLGVLTNGATGFEQVSASYDQVFVLSGASVKTKIISQAIYGTGDAVQGSTYDAGYGLSAESASIGGKNGFLIGNMAGAHPLASSATIMATVGSSTVANGIDFSSYTISGKFLNSTGFSVDGSGNISSNSLTTLAVITSVPATLTGTSGSTSSLSQIINASGTFTLTLPSAAANGGRWLYIKSIAAFAVNSASSNVVPISTATAGTAILTNTAGKWAWLQSDGANWITMAAN